MRDVGSITVNVTTNYRQSLARELREAADALDPRPPSETAEDLRGAQVEIERLQAGNTLLHNIADAAMSPADTEPPAALSIPWPPDEAIVEKVAQVLHNLGHPDGCYCGALGWEAWASDARAVLDALAGDR